MRKKPIIKLKDEAPNEIFRASHLCICDKCKEEYINHQMICYCDEGEKDLPISRMRIPLVLFLICDGRLVKL